MKNGESDQKQRAAADLRAIEELKRSPAFNDVFMRRVNEEVKKREDKVLTDRTLTAEQLFQERLLYLAALDTSKLMERDEAACRRTLGSSDAGLA